MGLHHSRLHPLSLLMNSRYAPARFWLASCIEVFMRGSDPRHQDFVAQFGLMEHIVEQILKPGFQLSSDYQVSSSVESAIVHILKATGKAFSNGPF